MNSVESRVQKQIEDKNAELAEKVEAAKLDQLVVQFEQDLGTLTARMPTPESQAIEAAKDKLFLRDRQRTQSDVNQFSKDPIRCKTFFSRHNVI